MNDLQLTIEDGFLGLVFVGPVSPEPLATPSERPPTVEADVLRETHASILPKEHNFVGNVSPYLETMVRWRLTTGRDIVGRSFTYTVSLPFEYLGVVLRTHVVEPLTVDEAIEMVSVMKETSERIHRGADARCEVLVEPRGESTSLGNWLSRIVDVSYVQAVPVIYISRFTPWVDNSRELLERFGSEVAALLNRWIHRTEFLKPELVADLSERDSHPFDFGVTLLSPVCTVEIHPKRVEKAAAMRGRSVEEHHLREWAFLAGTVLLTAFQREVLAADARTLDALVSPKGNWRTWRFWSELRALKGLSKTRMNLITRMDTAYYRVWSAPREFMDDSLTDARRRFRIDILQESVRERLEQLNTEISARYAAQISTIGLWVAFAAFVAAVAALL